MLGISRDTWVQVLGGALVTAILAGFGFIITGITFGYSGHSGAGDLWIRLGIATIALGVLGIVFGFVVLHQVNKRRARREREELNELLSETALAVLKSSGDYWAYGVNKDQILPEIAAEMISAELMDVEPNDRLRLNQRGVRTRNYLLAGVNPRPRWQVVRPLPFINEPTFGTPTVTVSLSAEHDLPPKTVSAIVEFMRSGREIRTAIGNVPETLDPELDANARSWERAVYDWLQEHRPDYAERFFIEMPETPQPWSPGACFEVANWLNTLDRKLKRLDDLLEQIRGEK